MDVTDPKGAAALASAKIMCPGVNFINVKRANFLYECHFFYVHVTRKSCRNVTFVQKIRTFNVDEIDTRQRSFDWI